MITVQEQGYLDALEKLGMSPNKVAAINLRGAAGMLKNLGGRVRGVGGKVKGMLDRSPSAQLVGGEKFIAKPGPVTLSPPGVGVAPKPTTSPVRPQAPSPTVQANKRREGILSDANTVAQTIAPVVQDTGNSAAAAPQAAPEAAPEATPEATPQAAALKEPGMISRYGIPLAVGAGGMYAYNKAMQPDMPVQNPYYGGGPMPGNY